MTNEPARHTITFTILYGSAWGSTLDLVPYINRSREQGYNTIIQHQLKSEFKPLNSTGMTKDFYVPWDEQEILAVQNLIVFDPALIPTLLQIKSRQGSYANAIYLKIQYAGTDPSSVTTKFLQYGWVSSSPFDATYLQMHMVDLQIADVGLYYIVNITFGGTGTIAA